MLTIGVCGTGLLDVFAVVICVATGFFGTVTNLTDLGGVLNWDVFGTVAAGVPAATVLTPHPVVITVF